MGAKAPHRSLSPFSFWSECLGKRFEPRSSRLLALSPFDLAGPACQFRLPGTSTLTRPGGGDGINVDPRNDFTTGRNDSLLLLTAMGAFGFCFSCDALLSDQVHADHDVHVEVEQTRRPRAWRRGQHLQPPGRRRAFLDGGLSAGGVVARSSRCPPGGWSRIGVGKAGGRRAARPAGGPEDRPPAPGT